jgi:hypothetical protein
MALALSVVTLSFGVGCDDDAERERRGGDDTASSTTGAGGSGGSGGAAGQGGEAVLGNTCDEAYPLGEPIEAGTYQGAEPFPGSCSGAGAALWFSVTPSAAGCYRLASNALAPAFTTHALFEGLSCDPLGLELDCRLASQAFRDTDRFLEAGQGYLFVIAGGPLVNPSAGMSLVSTDPGNGCQLPRDVSGETFPLQVNGDFRCEPLAAGSCVTEAYNALWFAYTATSSSTHTITVTNSCSSCDSNLAVFDGSSCEPLGNELACESVSGPSATATAALATGTDYRIVYTTSNRNHVPLDPEITITP